MAKTPASSSRITLEIMIAGGLCVLMGMGVSALIFAQHLYTCH